MGSVLSKVKVLRIAVKQVLQLNAAYTRLLKRIKADPGLPVSNPTLSFWHDVPSPLASHRPNALPSFADVVIIGSGITGTSVAHTLLTETSKDEGGPQIVMLEARDVCSGATGRNGGHIKPPLHHDYLNMKKKFGFEQARKLMRFRLMHIDELLRLATSEQILNECQCRAVESMDVYFDHVMFQEAKEQLVAWKNDMPNESAGFYWVDGKKAAERFHLAPDVAGVIYNQAGAIHPYRFVTHILAKLLKTYGDRFCLSTNTPCTGILPPSHSRPFYTVITPQGKICTPHVVHATNAWASHLLEPMRTKIFAVRGNMSAQRPGAAASPSTLDGGRSWVFYDKHIGYDYLTQLPSGERELMFGGGYFQGGDDGLSELGTFDDSQINPGFAAHLAGSLPLLFGGQNWGAEAAPVPSTDDGRWHKGRVKALWSGIIGISADRVPWVGRLPPKLSGRRNTPFPFSSPACNNHEICSPHLSTVDTSPETTGKRIVAPGEWLAAGFSGEGMAHAFMSGRALALQVLGREDDAKEWFPECMGITELRWENARAEDLLQELWG